MYLTDLESERVERLRLVVEQAAPGHYSLKQLCGEEWSLMADYNSFSRKFKRLVEEGMMPGVRLHPTKGAADTLVYVVHSQASHEPPKAALRS